MKQIIFITIAMMITGVIFSQAPLAFNYQGVVRDLSGNPLPNQNVGLQISLIEGSALGTEVYKEVHSTSTNNLGLFNISIGEGTRNSGFFEDIDWQKEKYFVQLEIDENGGSDYQFIGVSQLLSVPYSIFANRVGLIQSDNQTGVVSHDLTDFPLDNIPETSTFNVFIKDTKLYSPDLQQTDGLAIFHRDNKSRGDVCLKLSSRSSETFDANNELHSAATVVLNSVSVGLDKADFTIQNEYSNPNIVKETFRIKYNGNVGIGTSDPKSILQVSSGDIYIESINRGVIMKSDDGECWRMRVSNSGQPIFTSISCPN